MGGTLFLPVEGALKGKQKEATRLWVALLSDTPSWCCWASQDFWREPHNGIGGEVA